MLMYFYKDVLFYLLILAFISLISIIALNPYLLFFLRYDYPFLLHGLSVIGVVRFILTTNH